MASVMRDSTEYLVRRLLWISLKQSCFSSQKRFRYKPKWAMHEKPMTNCQLALKNFDAFNKPFYGTDWTSIRISLLSMPKYCAALNKYSDTLKNTDLIHDLGASSFIDAANTFISSSKLSFTEDDSMKPIEAHSQNSQPHYDLEENVHLRDSKADVNESLLNEDNFLDSADAGSDLNVFVPTDKIYSERDLILREELSLNAFESRQVRADVLPAEPLVLPSDLQAFIFPQGDVSMFPSPKPHHGLLGYYLMDAASTLPVIALNVQPDDQLLDLCAAPGGKTFLMLQALDIHKGGRLHCNDSAQARLTRLRSILKLHFPADVVDKVCVTKMNGTAPFAAVYNKVLVDAPCNSDRHVVTEDENNLFKVSRTRERLDFTQLQRNLLISGIKSCCLGGTIVYSTCTLSPAQNDGVIQAAIEELYETSEIEVAVQDLSNLQEAFSDTFKFHNNTKHGLTVLPNLMNNFGPSYLSKLRRTK